MKFFATVILAVTILVAGCASSATRALTAEELAALDRLKGRLGENRKQLKISLSDLSDITAQAVSEQHSLAVVRQVRAQKGGPASGRRQEIQRVKWGSSR